MGPLEFQTVLFNFHDVILLLTAMQCLFFGVLLCVTNAHRIKSTYFLAAFLFAHALIPVNELMMWGAEFKLVARQLWPQGYFIIEGAYFLDGPLLYLCIKSLVFRDFALRKVDLLHLLPAIAFAVFMATVFYSHSVEQRLEMIADDSFVYSTGFISVEFLSKWVRVFYAAASILLISRYKNLLKETQSNMEKVHIIWLKGLVIGFLVVMSTETILVGAKYVSVFIQFEVWKGWLFQTLGLTGYYLSFALVNLLVFTAIRHFWLFEPVADEELSKKPIDEELLNPEMASEVDTAIRKEKTYMEPDITLDTLAESLAMMPRDLSMLINRHFGVNFYEFVNRYRIEEAKLMLVAPETKDTTITDIYLAVGFNSKSVFYTFFKKFEGVTPTQFRQSVS